jgi:hypothetical protein
VAPCDITAAFFGPRGRSHQKGSRKSTLALSRWIPRVAAAHSATVRALVYFSTPSFSPPRSPETPGAPTGRASRTVRALRWQSAPLRLPLGSPADRPSGGEGPRVGSRNPQVPARPSAAGHRRTLGTRGRAPGLFAPSHRS